MITKISEYKKFLESFEAPKNFKINMVPKDRMKNIINPYGSRLGEDDRPGVEIFGRQSPQIPELLGFKRILYKENNPKHKYNIDIGPLDVIYEKQIKGVEIFSEWQHKRFQKNDFVLGDAVYYGWRSDSEYLDNHYFVAITTVKPNGRPDYGFMTDTTLTKEEMIDTVTKLNEQIIKYTINAIEYLNPSQINDGILDDSADYFH